MAPWKRTVVVLVALCLITVAVALYYKTLIRGIYDDMPRKFSKRKGIFTATPKYSISGDQFTGESKKLQYMDLPPINLSSQPFGLEDTDMVAKLEGGQMCVPKNFGYSAVAGEDLFPPYLYPLCTSKLPRNLPTITMNDTAFTVECEKGEPKYAIQPNGFLPDGFYLYPDISNKWTEKKYPGHPVSLGDSEFVFATCEEKISQVQYNLRFNETVYNRAKSIMDRLGVKRKPMTILLLTIDSYSRRHFYRKMNHTVQYLNSLNEAGVYSVFDFKLHNIKGGNSVENMIPIFTNISVKSYDDPPFKDLLGPGALWELFKDMGYATLWGFEDCQYHFPQVVGKRLPSDHLIHNFYCAVSALLGTTAEKDETEQRCVGSYMSHYYALNYTLAFMRAYGGVNQLISVHLDSAHEATGQHAATLDDDLKDFLDRFMQENAQTGNELVVFLQADHGMRYGNWFKDISAYQELKLPVFYLIARNEFLDTIPRSREILWNNTFRLTSKLDIRASILGLSRLPYGEVYPVHSDEYLKGAVDLLRENSSYARTCEDAGIEPWYCSCLVFERIDAVGCPYDSDSLGHLLSAVAAQALYTINREVSTSLYHTDELLCQRLTFDFVRKAYGLNLDNGEELLRVEFAVKENPEARFEVLGVVGAVKGSDFLRLENDRYELLPIIYNGFQARIRILGVERKDRYAGPCEVVARANGLKAEYCVCNDLESLRATAPGLFKRIRSH